MKCSHCNSPMQIVDRVTYDKSSVSFYRCTICEAEHVSSSMLTTGRLDDRASLMERFSPSLSQNQIVPVL